MDDKKNSILKARAAVLSLTKEEQSQENALEVLKFLINREFFAVELKFVSEVSTLREYTVLPTAPPHIFGVMSVRRSVVPIIDLSELFSITRQEKSKIEKVIILKEGNLSFAIRTSGILGVVAIPISQIQAPPTTLPETQSRFLKGITKEGISLLDGEVLIHG